jgi:CRP-like cAMP-binding protein
MSVALTEAQLCANHLLAKLSPPQLQALLPRLDMVELNRKDVIHKRGEPIGYVHFPCSAAISALMYLENGTAVEVSTVGNEGFSSVELLINASVAIETAICQIAGKSLRMKASDFKEHIQGDTPLRHLAECYFQGYLAQVSQSVACNRLHTIEERFARWLLITHDRVRDDDFYLTQEFLSDMLGVHRPSVSLIAGAFQSAGMIRYSRGHMKILNRAALEDTACECYGAVRAEFKRVLGIPYG